MPTTTTVMPRITQRRSHQYFPSSHPLALGSLGSAPVISRPQPAQCR